MNKQRKWVLAVLIAWAMAAGAHAVAAEPAPAEGVAAATAGELKQVSVARDGQGHPAVTLAGAGLGTYETQVLEHPDRLVLDLTGTVSRLAQNQVSVGADGVVRVRAGQFRRDPKPVTRVVFDLDRKVDWKVEKTDAGLVVAFGANPPAAAAETPASPEAAPVAAAAAPTAAPEAPAKTAPAAAEDSRSVSPDVIQKLLRAPNLAAEQAPAETISPAPTAPSFETKKITTDTQTYTGKKISLNLVDTDIKQIFRLFHEISGLNFVLDPGVDGKVTIVLDNVPWDQALDIILKNNGLDKVLENNVIRIATTQKLATEAAARKQFRDAKELEVEPVTVTRTLSYAKAKDVERVIRDGGVLSVRGKVIVDERTNALIISDIPKKVEPLDKLISTLDSETPQVMIEARIVETSKAFTQDLGVKWGFKAIADASHGTSTNLKFPRNASVGYDLDLQRSQTGVLGFSFGNILDSFTLNVALDALETEGKGRTLSAPKIATQNNERAEIEQGVRIPVVTTTATQINVQFVSASLKLTVTPQITADGTVVLDIAVENNSPDFANRVGDVPPIKTQRAQTKVLVADGGTTVIGGIFTVSEGTTDFGVPWFRKIPGLGWLFKSRTIDNRNTELLIFITPKIVKVG